MINNDFISLLNADSIIIDSGAKAGKITFLFYLVKFLYKDKVIIFTPQESYLFERRIKALSGQFPQFSDLKDLVTPYFLKENWNSLKQKYGYDFFLTELTRVILSSEEKVIVIHRVGEFFEFQDRYEIENIYKSLVKLATQHKKKIIFLANNKNENFEYIHGISEEFTDVSISIKNNDKNERLLNVKDVLHNKEYPLLHFRIHKENFILDLYEKNQEITDTKDKNILIAELDQVHDNMKEILEYIFDKKNFSVKHADSLQSVLREIFISPDVIIVLMKRNKNNFDTITAIKQHLPDTIIVGIVDQEFIRIEDVQEAYSNGCDELFANNLSFESLLLSLQKASKTPFYSNCLNSLPVYNNVLHSLDDFKSLANECILKTLFFTAFVIETEEEFEFVKSSSRKNDYLYQTKHKIYYLALSTLPKDISYIVGQYKKKYSDLKLTCIWEPINHKSLDSCI